jgi:hypothetical protein
MWESDVMVGNFCHAAIARNDLDDVVAALEKVANGAATIDGQETPAIDASRMAEGNAA